MNNEDNNTSPVNEEQRPSSAKRKSDDGHPQQRAKRNRYISIACNECKRRKIKCNGETPCQRCGRLSLECLYAPNCCNNFKDTDDFKRMDAHISSLQEQVDNLYNSLNSFRAHVDTSNSTPVDSYQNGSFPRSSISQTPAIPPSPSRTRTQPVAKLPRFHGPTSSAFNLGVAKTSLQTMGITGPEVDDQVDTVTATPVQSPPPQPSNISKVMHQSKDPIWALDKTEAIRLCNVWHEEMGLMNPFMNIDDIISHATLLYTFVEAAYRNGLTQLGLPGADSIHDDKTNMLKLILAIALTLEGGGRSELGKKMFETVAPNVQTQMMGDATPESVKLLGLAAMYHFHRDDEALAWRVIGLAARICLELGLHRKETYSTIFDTAERQTQGIRLFWSIYVLDRRWSFGTGMPFVLQDADIDPQLPRPDDATPYLTAMVAYSQIGSKVWKSVANVDSTRNLPINREEISYLDYKVVEWLNSIPSSLTYTHPSNPSSASNRAPNDTQTPRGIHRLKVALYLRANQMRILIYRPILHTATSILENPSLAERVVQIAKDTILVLQHTNATTDLYRSQQCMFNYFLISALAVLFLAVSHAPARFSALCRQEFCIALDLVRGLSASSHVSKRLWRTIKVLKEVAPQLGLNVQNQNQNQNQGQAERERQGQEDAHSSAAVAMAGLAGHNVDEMALFGHGHGHTPAHHNGNATVANGIGAVGPAPMSNSPNGMANDLTSLFEAAGGFANTMLNGGGGYQDGAGLGGGLGQEDELARIMRDLF